MIKRRKEAVPRGFSSWKGSDDDNPRGVSGGAEVQADWNSCLVWCGEVFKKELGELSHLRSWLRFYGSGGE